MPLGISVVVCCFNSAAKIAPTLAHLLNQKDIQSSSWELIIVDNGSTDNTSEKAALIWQSFEGSKPMFKVVHESNPGLSFARKRGIDESNFDFVLFCDDDNWLEENYLSISLSIMQSSPYIGVLGGTGYPVFEDKEPPYFWSNQFHALAVGVQSAIEGDITDTRGVLYGAGMVLNKKAFRILHEKYRFRFLLSDRIKGSLASSGDHELCLALRKIGYRIFYSKIMRFKHFIPAFRTTISYYRKLFMAFGRSYALLHVYSVNKSNLNHFKNDYRYICLRCLKNIFISETKLVLKGYYFQKERYKYVDLLHQLYSNIGVLRTFINIKNLYREQFFNHPLFSSDSTVVSGYATV